MPNLRPSAARRGLALLVAASLLLPAGTASASAPAADPPAEGAPALMPPLPDPPPQPPRPFPDPVLTKKMRHNRYGGAALTLSGIASLLVAINLGVYNVRSPGVLDEQAWPVVGFALFAYGGAGLSIGAPLWSLGAEMRIQLGRINVGDELVRREVANDPAYWRARAQSLFGTSIAVNGAGQVVFGTLSMVLLASAIDAGNFESDEAQQALADRGISDPRVLLAGPAFQIVTGSALLVTGASLWDKGRRRSRAIRDAAAVARALPVPTFDPRTGAAGLAWNGRF